MSPPFPVAAGRYEAFRLQVWSLASPVVRGSERLYGDELEIQAQWFGGEFGRVFSGTEDEKIEIVQFGYKK